MEILINWAISALIIFSIGYLLPGIHLANFTSAFITALVLGIINAFLKPVLIVLTLPINIISLGLFTLVLNALLVLLAAKIVPGFRIDGFWWAVVFSIVLSLANSFLQNRRD